MGGETAERYDELIQGVTAALYALELGKTDVATGHLEKVLDAAREMLRDATETTEPPSFVRDAPADLD